MAEVYRNPTPQDADSIEAIAARRYEQELEIRDILTQFFDGDESQAADWFFIRIDDEPFNGRIPASALISHSDKVYQYVKDNYQ